MLTIKVRGIPLDRLAKSNFFPGLLILLKQAEGKYPTHLFRIGTARVQMWCALACASSLIVLGSLYPFFPINAAATIGLVSFLVASFASMTPVWRFVSALRKLDKLLGVEAMNELLQKTRGSDISELLGDYRYRMIKTLLVAEGPGRENSDSEISEEPRKRLKSFKSELEKIKIDLGRVDNEFEKAREELMAKGVWKKEKSPAPILI